MSLQDHCDLCLQPPKFTNTLKRTMDQEAKGYIKKNEKGQICLFVFSEVSNISE